MLRRSFLMMVVLLNRAVISAAARHCARGPRRSDQRRVQEKRRE
jgi:hypothetical protein